MIHEPECQVFTVDLLHGCVNDAGLKSDLHDFDGGDTCRRCYVECICHLLRWAYQRARDDAAMDVVHSIWRTEGCSFDVVLQDAVDTVRDGFRR